MPWTLEKKYALPMGDTYEVHRDGKRLRGNRLKKNGERSSVVCITCSRLVIQEYYETAVQVDKECLRGDNPYVSKMSANRYAQIAAIDA